MTENKILLSVVIPAYNEAEGLETFNGELIKYVKEAVGGSYEIIYCNDGSSDNTAEIVSKWHKSDPRIRLVSLTRNFGKEYSLLSGISVAKGDALLMIDGDGQHPVELIPEFVKIWQKGAKVVVGVRKDNGNESTFKNLGSKSFYFIFNKLTSQHLVPSSTDYRLIDKSVQRAFLDMPETGRITRGMIDWLGFSTEHIYFDAKPRKYGSVGYSNRKLLGLAANSFVSLTPRPLYIFGYLGILITAASLVLGVAVLIEQIILNDPLHWRFTGTAMLGILILCLVGIVLMSQGILSLYVSNINNQSKGRPLFVVDYEKSAGIEHKY
ncbi:MAG: glycosyltransferase family 2 protein [Candidatus Saccharibacteria bacterium]